MLLQNHQLHFSGPSTLASSSDVFPFSPASHRTYLQGYGLPERGIYRRPECSLRSDLIPCITPECSDTRLEYSRTKSKLNKRRLEHRLGQPRSIPRHRLHKSRREPKPGHPRSTSSGMCCRIHENKRKAAAWVIMCDSNASQTDAAGSIEAKGTGKSGRTRRC